MGLSEAIATADSHIAVITRMGAGSQPDLAIFFATTSPLVFALVVRMIGDRAIAEGVLMDIYVQVWKQAGHYDPRQERPLPWLLRLARQQAVNYLRTTERPAVQMSAPSNQAAEPQGARAVLACLPAEQLQVIEMAYFGGLTYYQIAHEFGVSPNIIKQRIGFALKCLLQKLMAYPEAGDVRQPPAPPSQLPGGASIA